MELFEAGEVELVKTVTELYYIDKKLMLYAEELNRQETFIPPINEIRDAFDHLMRAFAVKFELISENHDYVATNLNKTFSHIYRATFDLLDYISIYQREIIATKLDGISRETLANVYPKYYDQIVPDIENLFSKIPDIREHKDIGNPNLDDIKSYVELIEKVKSHISDVNAMLPSLIEYDKEKQKNKRKEYATYLIIGIVCTMLGLILGLYLQKFVA